MEDYGRLLFKIQVNRYKALKRLLSYFVLFLTFAFLSPSLNMISAASPILLKLSLLAISLFFFLGHIILIFSFFKGLVGLARKKILLELYDKGIYGLMRLTGQDIIEWDDIMFVETQFSTFYFFTRSYLVIHVKDTEKYYKRKYLFRSRNEGKYCSHIVVRVPDIMNYSADQVASFCSHKIREQ